MMGSFSIAETGVITYSKKGGDGKPIFQCHPVEKPFRKLSLPQPISSRQRDEVELMFLRWTPSGSHFPDRFVGSGISCQGRQGGSTGCCWIVSCESVDDVAT